MAPLSKGPLSKKEALQQAGSIVADWVDDATVGELYPGVKMTPHQVVRATQAMAEISRRLRAMGAAREEPS